MYCSNCGAKAGGNFCSSCGFKLMTKAEQVATVPNETEEVQFEGLLKRPDIRDKIAHHAAFAKQGVSGEQFLELCDMALSSVSGVSLGTVAKIAIPIYSRMGIQTGKQRRDLIPRPVETVFAAALCSLAHQGQVLKQIHQAEDGCIIEAKLPSDVWSFEGDLIVSLARHSKGTSVDSSTKIPGQIFDWGKSQRCLKQLVENLHSL